MLRRVTEQHNKIKIDFFIVDNLNNKNKEAIRKALLAIKGILNVELNILKKEIVVFYSPKLKSNDLFSHIKFLEKISNIKIRGRYKQEKGRLIN